MASIFSSINFADFWKIFTQRNHENFPKPILSATFTTFKGDKKSRKRYQLHPSRLVQLDSTDQPKKYADLNLRTFKPFIESSSAGESYLFRLDSHEFYVDSEEILNEWINHLRKKCILDSFEDDFILIKTIGKGGTSTVYLAEEISTRKEFAVKCLNKESMIKHDSEVWNLSEEIKIHQGINHDKIAKLHYVYEDSIFIYMVMEYLPYGDLCKRLLVKKKFDDDTCAKFMKDLLETIDFLHSQNIVHRDLKLENIVMTEADGCDFKIIDFGLAYSSCATQSKKCGSPGYLAPEILDDRRYDNKIDIFSAGVILYVLLYGKQPFIARNTDKVLLKNWQCEYNVNKKISVGAAEVLILMLEREPEYRPTASQILHHPWFKRNCVLSWDSNKSNVTSQGL